MFRKEDPFPAPTDLLDTCHIFFSPAYTGEGPKEDFRAGTRQGDDLRQSFELRRRMKGMLSGWEYRDLQIDHRFVGPSTIPGYYTRRTKIIRSSTTRRTTLETSPIVPRTRTPCDGDILNRKIVSTDAVHESNREDEQAGLEQEDEDQAEASPIEPVLPTSLETRDDVERHTKSRSNGLATVIWMEWFVVYHPTYRIPSMCFSASWEDGTVLDLHEILDYGILRPPTSTSVTSPDDSEVVDDHLPLSSDSSFPLLMRESHPSSSVNDLGVWAVHPCHVKPHITELLLADESHSTGAGMGGQEQQLAEDDEKMRKRWMEIWFMLHSRLLGDL